MNKTDKMQMVAKTMLGLEEVLKDELLNIGAGDVEVLKRAVSFTGNMEVLYKANYTCRTALSVLTTLATFEAKNEQELYDGVYQIHWEHILDVDCTFIIEPVVHSNIFKHSQYAALKTKDAIVDRFRKLFNRRPDIDKENPNYYINLHISESKVSILLNSSGESLHKRGYRQRVGEAPINEVLAAGLLQLTGWKCDTHIFDPMCGSGTFLIEAAMLASHIPAQYYRKNFAFKNWKEYNVAEWKRVVENANKQIKEFDFEIWGSDQNERAIENAQENCKFAKLHHDIQLFTDSIDKQSPPEGPCLIIMNPPYGERLSSADQNGLYECIGTVMKHQYGHDKTVWIISSDFQALKHIGLKPSKKTQIFNGALDCRFLKFELYDGSRKIKNKSEEE